MFLVYLLTFLPSMDFIYSDVFDPSFDFEDYFSISIHFVLFIVYIICWLWSLFWCFYWLVYTILMFMIHLLTLMFLLSLYTFPMFIVYLLTVLMSLLYPFLMFVVYLLTLKHVFLDFCGVSILMLEIDFLVHYCVSFDLCSLYFGVSQLDWVWGWA